jgi:[ribosomal protein S18]-alanine N-acetyltransferase
VSELVIRPMLPGEGAITSRWRYPPPYDIYNDDREVVDDPDLASAAGEQYAILERNELVGFCTFGTDARVPGGEYADGPLDIGMGMRPDLTGRGHGARYLAAVLDFARRELGETAMRATIAELNARALRMCERAGFRRSARFENRDRAYWILFHPS